MSDWKCRIRLNLCWHPLKLNFQFYKLDFNISTVGTNFAFSSVTQAGYRTTDIFRLRAYIPTRLLNLQLDCKFTVVHSRLERFFKIKEIFAFKALWDIRGIVTHDRRIGFRLLDCLLAGRLTCRPWRTCPGRSWRRSRCWPRWSWRRLYESVSAVVKYLRGRILGSIKYCFDVFLSPLKSKNFVIFSYCKINICLQLWNDISLGSSWENSQKSFPDEIGINIKSIPGSS
jgi:hypothetical protein